MAAQQKNYKALSKLEVFYTGGPSALLPGGEKLACACGDDVKVVSTDGAAVHRTLPGDSEPVTCLAASPNGRTLYVASRSLTLRGWDLETGSPGPHLKGHRGPVSAMAVHPSGGLLATGSADHTTRVWDVDGGFCTHQFGGHGNVVLSVVFRPHHLELITASADGDIIVWDLSKKAARLTLKGHFSATPALAVSTDGNTLVSGSRDRVVKVWDLRSGACTATVPVFEAVECVAVVPSALAARLCPGHEAVCFATGGDKGRVRFWRADGARCVAEQAEDGAVTEAGALVDLFWTDCGQDDSRPPAQVSAQILSTTQDGRVLVHELSAHLPEKAARPRSAKPCAPLGPRCTLTQHLIGNNDQVTDVRLLRLAAGAHASSSGGSRPTHVAVATNSETVRLFRCDGSMGVAGSLAGHTAAVLSLDAWHDWEAGACLLASGSKDCSVRTWRLSGGGGGTTAGEETSDDRASALSSLEVCCSGVGAGHVGAVTALALAPKRGRWLLSGGADRLIKVWDVSASRERRRSAEPAQLETLATIAAHDKDVNAVAISPNDALACSASADRTARLWKLPDLTPGPVLKGHRRGVWGVAFSPVDQAVATSSADRTLRLWNVRDGACLRVFEGHLSSALRVSFAAAGAMLLSAGAEGLLKLWNARTGECPRTLEAAEDKVWALGVGLQPAVPSADAGQAHNFAGAEDAVLATGGGDGSLVLWEDCTVEDIQGAAAEADAALLADQKLANAMQPLLHDLPLPPPRQANDLVSAAQLAFKARQPGRLLAVLAKSLDCQDLLAAQSLASWSVRSSPAVAALAERACETDEDAKALLEYAREWNTTSRNAAPAQAVLAALLSAKGIEGVAAVPGVGPLLEALVAYSERHAARLERMHRASFVLDHVLEAARVLAPELAPESSSSDEEMEVQEQEAEAAVSRKGRAPAANGTTGTNGASAKTPNRRARSQARA